VLWANFSYILDELEQDFKKNGVDFYRVPREKQREAINKKVDELIEQNKEQEEINVGGTLQAATPGVRPPVGQAEEEAD
jgi:TRAP-type C4-dicarboxylate transport system substrate-binding protein